MYFLYRQSVLPKLVASFTNSNSRRKLACPLSTITYPDVTFLKYNSAADKVLTLDEIGIALRKGQQSQLLRLLSNKRRESQIAGCVKLLIRSYCFYHQFCKTIYVYVGLADSYRRSTLSTSTNQSVEIARQYSGKIKYSTEMFFSLIMLP